MKSLSEQVSLKLVVRDSARHLQGKGFCRIEVRKLYLIILDESLEQDAGSVPPQSEPTVGQIVDLEAHQLVLVAILVKGIRDDPETICLDVIVGNHRPGNTVIDHEAKGLVADSESLLAHFYIECEARNIKNNSKSN